MGGAGVPADCSRTRRLIVALATPSAVRLTIALVAVADIAHRLVPFRSGGDADVVDVVANGARRRVVEEAVRIVAENGVVDRVVRVEVSFLSARQSALLYAVAVPEINAGAARGLRVRCRGHTRRKSGDRASTLA